MKKFCKKKNLDLNKKCHIIKDINVETTTEDADPLEVGKILD